MKPTHTPVTAKYAAYLQGATVLDFAYHVHTDVGNYMIGAKVNGKYVTASHQLANSEIVDILTYDGPVTKNNVARHKVDYCFAPDINPKVGVNPSSATC